MTGVTIRAPIHSTGVTPIRDRGAVCALDAARNVLDMDSSALSQPSLTTPDAAPRLGLGWFGITVRIVVAIAILMLGNVVAGLAPAALALIPGAMELLSGVSPWGFAVAIAMQVLVLAIVVVAVWGWMRCVERRPLRFAGWRWNRRSPLYLLLGILAAAGSLVAVTALLPSTAPVLDDGALLGGRSEAPTALLIAYYLGLAFLQQAIPEELLFRGWLIWRLRDRPALAVVVTTLAFTVIHLVSNGGQESVWEHVMYLALPLGFALLAAGLLLWTGSLWAAVGVHGGFHVGNYIAAATLPQVDSVASWLAIGGVQALIGLVLVVTALRHGKRILPDGEE